MGPDGAWRLQMHNTLKTHKKMYYEKKTEPAIMSEAISTTANFELRMSRYFYRVIVRYRCETRL